MVKPVFILEALLVIGIAASISVIVGLRKNQILSKSDKVKTFFTFLFVYGVIAVSIFLGSNAFLV